jgi:hypothetical protein
LNSPHPNPLPKGEGVLFVAQFSPQAECNRGISLLPPGEGVLFVAQFPPLKLNVIVAYPLSLRERVRVRESNKKFFLILFKPPSHHKEFV